MPNETVLTGRNPQREALDEAHARLAQAAMAAMADGSLPEAALPEFITEKPGDAKNGDVAGNIAMAGARVWRRAPRQIAEAICAHLDLEGSCFERAGIAGPGFINLFLAPAFYTGVLRAAACDAQYGRTAWGAGKRINVEFVSANPTGPMHLGNARGGALGDGLAAVLEWSGHEVCREFYINDAGNQIRKFGKSLAVRYLQERFGAAGFPLPEDCYQGADILDLARAFEPLHGAEVSEYVSVCQGLSGDELYQSPAFTALADALTAYALPENVAGIRRDLEKYRVRYDVWFPESTLHESGAVKDVVDKLLESGACYRAQDGSVMYRSAQYAAKYGVANRKKDDAGAKDEVLVRSNGIPTYFAADIAYHYNKLAVRGFDKAIDVWGADHHGHVARMKGAMDAIGLDGAQLDVVLMQLVNLMRDGQPVRMSKRTGKAVSLADLLDEVPIDSARFFFNQREAGSTMDFDIGLAVREDSDNPVYYVQYAHARICSVLKKLEEDGVSPSGCEAADASVLVHPAELELLRLLAAFPAEIVLAAQKYDPARVTRFAVDIAAAFHKFYNACRIRGAEPEVQRARLALCVGVRGVIRNILTMFKISAPETM